jgi:hypothetical protein
MRRLYADREEKRVTRGSDISGQDGEQEQLDVNYPNQRSLLERGEQPPNEGYHVLLVHRFSSDWRALVHDITGRVPPSAGKVCHLTGRNAFTGTPGEALRAADQMATECGAPVVYVRDDT